MFFLIPALVFISVSLAVFAGYRLWHQQQTVKERIGQYKEEPDEEQDHQAAAGSSQLKRGLTRLAALLTVKEKGPGYQKLRRQLLLAGEPGKLKPQ